MKIENIHFPRTIISYPRRLFSFVALTLSLILVPAIAYAQTDVTLAWDANSEPDVAGYNLYYGTTSGNYTTSIDVGNSTQHTITDLQEGATYYFAATAYDDNDLESDYSAEVVHTVGDSNHNPQMPSTPAGPTGGNLQTDYSFSTGASDPDGDDLDFRYDWGDGTVSDWGLSSQSHAWTSSGNFCVKAQAADIHGANSAWSSCAAISIDVTTHTITASAGAHGSITPEGSVSVANGAHQSFSISADQNYQILEVLVDGVSAGAVGSYSFNTVSANHTISASFVAVNQAPVANAGPDLTVTEDTTVTLDGGNSTDPGGAVVSYSWEQTEGLSVELSNANSQQATFVAPSVGISGETLRFRLTVTDSGDLQSVDSCEVYVSKSAVEDSDGDGVPDDQDDFPYDPDESSDTDGDGQGNNADTDDDNDGMPDTWEIVYGLNPLSDDAADDPDGDEVSNINEYHLGTEPDYNEGNFNPEPPLLLTPADYETVGLTPLLETEDFFDPNVNDIHSHTQWQIIRTLDGVCVFDVTTESSLTALTVPKLILEEDTDYIWRSKFSDHHGGDSDWSEDGYFRTAFIEHDSDGNGVPDHQEVNEFFDLDGDGVKDREQADIKCVATNLGNYQIGVSIKDSQYVDSIVAIESEAPDNVVPLPPFMEGPNYLAFDLVHFKLLVNQPGDEVEVTIYLSLPAYTDGTWYKYNPVNDEWLDYSDYTEFSADRRAVFLRIKDGGFGDVDGIENGIIVDPLAFRTVSDHNGGSDSDSFIEEFFEGIIPEISCFITTAAVSSSDGQSLNLWREIRGRELSILFVLIVIAYAGRAVFQRINRSVSLGTKGDQSWSDAHKGWR